MSDSDFWLSLACIFNTASILIMLFGPSERKRRRYTSASPPHDQT